MIHLLGFSISIICKKERKKEKKAPAHALHLFAKVTWEPSDKYVS